MLFKMRIYRDVVLHTDYHRILIQGLQDSEDETKCIKMVISKLESLQDVEEFVKLFTVLHRLLI